MSESPPKVYCVWCEKGPLPVWFKRLEPGEELTDEVALIRPMCQECFRSMVEPKELE